jgi:hypothetical protein
LYGPGWCSELEFDQNATVLAEFPSIYLLF